jgi:hypothetical protein
VTDQRREALYALREWAMEGEALRKRHRAEQHEHDHRGLALCELGRTLGLSLDEVGTALSLPDQYPRTPQSLVAWLRGQQLRAKADLDRELRDLLDEDEDE